MRATITIIQRPMQLIMNAKKLYLSSGALYKHIYVHIGRRITCHLGSSSTDPAKHAPATQKIKKRFDSSWWKVKLSEGFFNNGLTADDFQATGNKPVVEEELKALSDDGSALRRYLPNNQAEMKSFNL